MDFATRFQQPVGPSPWADSGDGRTDTATGLPPDMVAALARPSAETLARAGIEFGPEDKFVSFDPAPQRGAYGANLPNEISYIPFEGNVFEGGCQPTDFDQGPSGICGPASILKIAAADDPAAMQDSVRDLNDGTVLVRHHNLEPPAPDGLDTRVAEGFTYYHIPKVVPVDADNPGSLLVADNAQGWWHTGHLLALSLADRQWTPQQWAESEAEWRKRKPAVDAERTAASDFMSCLTDDGEYIPPLADDAAPTGLYRLNQGYNYLSAARACSAITGRTSVVRHCTNGDAMLSGLNAMRLLGADVMFGTVDSHQDLGHDLVPDHWYGFGDVDSNGARLVEPSGSRPPERLSGAQLVAAVGGGFLAILPKVLKLPGLPMF